MGVARRGEEPFRCGATPTSRLFQDSQQEQEEHPSQHEGEAEGEAGSEARPEARLEEEGEEEGEKDFPGFPGEPSQPGRRESHSRPPQRQPMRPFSRRCMAKNTSMTMTSSDHVKRVFVYVCVCVCVCACV